MNEKNLKPCPFCGGEADIYSINGKKQVRCKRCRCRTPRMSRSDWFPKPEKDNTELAVEAWNRRVNENGGYKSKQNF